MRISCPRTPFQNCIVKRQNISIVKIGPSLMVPRSLPLKFWDTNFRITIHLLNHLPTKTLDHYNAYFLLYKKECLIIIYLEPIVGYVILNFVHLITTRLNLVPHLGCFLVIISAINDMCYEPLSQKTQISTHVVCHECFSLFFMHTSLCHSHFFSTCPNLPSSHECYVHLLSFKSH